MPKSYWLAKSEPDVFSIEDLAKAPDQTTFWDGVRNFEARNNLRAMKKGDLVFYYHSNASPSAVVGIAKVVREAYPDATAFDPKDDHYDPKSDRNDPTWFGVDVRLVEIFPRAVGLDEIKGTPALSEMALLKRSRLSVTPVTAAEWKAVCKLGRGK
ncbi:MAG TPA: EVE domain-containing protein [Candidatus Thermoplasmatota archaeon]|nr:EVE domain-containing protein [Candidatus Thermoplasmatota archaeon]